MFSGAASLFWKQHRAKIQIGSFVAAIAVAVAIPFIQSPLCAIAESNSDPASYRVTIERPYHTENDSQGVSPGISHFTFGPSVYSPVEEIERTQSTYYAAQQKEDWGRRYWCDIKATDYFLVLFTFFLAISSSLQIYWMARTVREATVQHETSERAFVFLDEFVSELTTLADQDFVPESLSDVIPELWVTRFVVIPRWRNSGTTPTRNMRLQVNWDIAGVRQVGTYRQTDEKLFVAPRGTALSEEIEMPGLGGGIFNSERMLIWGRADYDDVFGGHHFCEWCFRVRPDRHRRGIPLRVTFIQTGDYNRSGQIDK
jgi:hypothetical protein